jgi:hypothetical protein
MRGSPFYRRRYWALGLAAAAGALIPAAIASACVALVALNVNPQSVQPGGTVAVTGRDTAPGAPIEIHLDSPTGRLLATNPPHNMSVMQGVWTLNVTIPADVPPGEHFLVAAQDYHNHNAGMPARATIYVGQPAPAPAAPAARPTTLDVSTGPSAASLALVGLGVAAGAVLIAALVFLAASRRPSQPGAQAARTS